VSNTPALEALFFAALEIESAAERSAYLDSACGNDTELRRQVERLLNAHPRVGDFLKKPVVEQLAADPEHSPATQSPASSTEDRSAGPAGPNAPPAARPGSEGSGGDEHGALGFLQPSTRPDSLGRLDHYEVLEVLGQGGFGIVFRAFDEALQRVVAVKVLGAQLAATSPARKRFLREARSCARVQHKNVIQVYAVGEQPLPYLVMEFIPGETLQQRLDRAGPLEAAEVARIGRQIAEGLAAAHSTGLIHRDIKPANILIEGGPHERVKITDFGLARAADDASVSQSGIVAGTPMFMSPEQARGETLDHRADLFSLGSVLYTMASGRPPFRAKSTLAVLRRVAEDPPRPIPEIIPGAPPWLCDLIARLHAKKPEDRIATAGEVADLLGRGLKTMQRSGNIRLQPKVAPAAPGKNRPRSRPRLWAAAAAVFLLLLGGLAFAEAADVTNVRGTMIRLFSPEGTLVVEVDDPGVSVKIDGPELVITGAGAKEIRLKPGRYTLEAHKDGKLVREELVTVTKNGVQVVRVSLEAAKQPAETAPDTKAHDAAVWERVVSRLSAEQQVQAVASRLKDLNPGFDGKVAPSFDDGVVTGLAFSTEQVSDISPVRALTSLKNLSCRGPSQGKLIDLAPLRGLPLTRLTVRDNPVSDLSPLEGMNLLWFDCQFTNVSDLSPLKGMPLEVLYCGATKVTDLSPLKGMKLTTASFEGADVADLTPLKGMPLSGELSVGRNTTDLTPLRGMPLRRLTCAGATRLSDLTPLKGMPLTYLNLDGTQVSDLSPLKGMPLTWLGIPGTQVSDLTPLKGMKTLTYLGCNRLVTDLSPLQDLPLTAINGHFQPERDSGTLRGIKALETINRKPAAQFWKEVNGK
jgi:hypothetical protein